MTAKVVWKSDLNFIGSGNSGATVSLGSSQSAGGNVDGLSPMELIAIGLAGCTAMDVISILQKKKQEVTGFEVVAHTQRATDHPRVYTHITLEYIITGRQVDPEAVDRSIELSLSKYCSVHAMLEKAVEIDHRVTVLESA